MSFKDGIWKHLLLLFCFGVLVLSILGVKKLRTAAGQKPKQPVRSNRFEEMDKTLLDKLSPEGFQSYVQAAAPGRVVTNIPNPTTVDYTFAATPLDTAYNDYEQAESEALAEMAKAQTRVDIPQDTLPDFGALFGRFDAEIKDVPWDSDNRQFTPESVTWGYVSKEASKSIFNKVYHRELLANSDNMEENENGVPMYRSPIMPVSTNDPIATAIVQGFEGVVAGAINEYNPLMPQPKNVEVKSSNTVINPDGTRTTVIHEEVNGRKQTRTINTAAPDANGRTRVLSADTKKVKVDLGKVDKQLVKMGARAKQLLGINKAIKIAQAVKAKFQSKFASKISSFMAKKLIQAVAIRSAMYATQAGLTAAAVGTFGALAPVAAAWGVVVTVLEIVLTTIDVITAALTALLPPILEKVFDGNGRCPRGKTIDLIIDDEVAYFFFTNFLPLGGLFDLFGPYVCFEGTNTFLKQRVVTPAYYFDRTTSLYYHIWPEDQQPRGDSFFWRSNTLDRPDWPCVAGICREPCAPGMWTSSDVDMLCNQSSRVLVGTLPHWRPCDPGQRDDGTSCWEDWKGLGGGDCHTSCSWGGWKNTVLNCNTHCNPVYNKGGCGCIRKTRFDRVYCDPPRNLDGVKAFCKEPCKPGERNIADVCWGERMTYARGSFIPKSTKVMIPGFQPELDIARVSIPWCNFSSPAMLDRMAQFYYDNSFLNQQLITDESGKVYVQFEYIIKFYGVIASSELSCDVACDMRTVRYEPYTGANFAYSIGANYPDNPYDRRSYRRFYFIKSPSDPQTMFTVTGCTNSDYTAPEAQVNSWDDGAEYVPSLPKVFNMQQLDKDRSIDGATIKAVAVGAAAAGAAMAIGQGAGRLGSKGGIAAGAVGMLAGQLAGGVAAGAVSQYGDVAVNAVEQAGATAVTNLQGAVSSVNALLSGSMPAANQPVTFRQSAQDMKGMYTTDINTDPTVAGTPAAITDAMNTKLAPVALPTSTIRDGYVTGNRTDGYTLITRNEYFYINHGVVVEYASGIVPAITFCKNATMTSSQCTNKFILRDTINRYHAANPTRRVKQVDLIEPRGRDGCYYKFRETNYDPATNVEGSTFTTREIVQKYRINNLATCNFVPDGILTDLAAYPVRTSTTFNNANFYPTRRAITKPVRYARIEGGTDWLQFSQLVVFNTDFLNVSAGKRTSSSGVLQGCGQGCGEAIAVDGVVEARPFPNIYHSSGTGGWFEVDLGSNQNILYARIFNRSDYGPERLASGYKLRLLDANRILSYEFNLTADMIQTFTNFPPISLDRRFPIKSFEVPRPLPPDTTLGGTSCPTRKCQDREQIDRLVRQFNEANANTKIMRVLRGVTPRADRCDYEVEMMRMANGQKITARETVSINVRQSSTACLFDRVTDGSAALNSGTFIQDNTPSFITTDTSGGVFSFTSLLNTAKNTITAAMSPITALNPLKILKDNATSADTTATNTLTDVAANQSFTGCPQKRCTDTDILTAIMNRYNTDNEATTEQYGVERRTMQRILRAGAAGGNACDVVFQELVETYEDILYDPIETTTVTTLKRVKLAPTGAASACTFQVAAGSTAFTDISSQAIGILSASSALTTPFQQAKCNLDCRSTANLAAIKRLAETKFATASSIPTFKSVTQSYRNGATTCEYKMIKDVLEKDDYTKQLLADTDLETYLTATFTLNSANCTFTLADVSEFDPDKITTRTNPQTGEEDTIMNGQVVTMPMLAGFDETKPSNQVTVRITPFK